MTELNTLCINKRTMNSGYIFFEEEGRSKKMEDTLNEMHINYSTFVVRGSGHIYYGFKLFRMRKRFFEICAALSEEVLV